MKDGFCLLVKVKGFLVRFYCTILQKPDVRWLVFIG